MSSDQVIDDLDWAIQSPLLYGAPPPGYADWVDDAPEFLTQLRAHPERLPDDLAEQRRVPIGRYFERLMGLWLRNVEDISNIHENLPIQGDEGTLGELDLVFVHKGAAYHWELALKFYLGVGDRSSQANWHGPRGRDRLDKKLDKLSSHQLLLPLRPEGRDLLSSLGIHSVTSHRLIKGYLFQPFMDWQAESVIVPEGSNANHLGGWWLPLADAPMLGALPVAGWRFLDKPDWLGPVHHGALCSPDDLPDALLQRVSEAQSTMLAAVGPEGHEVHRGFIVPDTWPPLA